MKKVRPKHNDFVQPSYGMTGFPPICHEGDTTSVPGFFPEEGLTSPGKLGDLK